MAIIPVLRCSRIQPSIDFYTKVLDFNLADDGELTDPAFIFLRRAGDLLVLSSYGSGPIARSVVMVLTEDIDPLFDKFLGRGLKPAKPESPVHQGPTNQTWGTREFYVDDPDGNTLAFTQTMPVF
jgi:catechol 2,3-dioxygenase-like lactoylglutathione lyase family enzyme